MRQRNFKTWIRHSHASFQVQLWGRLRMREIIFIYHYFISMWQAALQFVNLQSRVGAACAQIVFSHRWAHYFHRLPQCRTPSVRTNYNINDRRCKSTSTEGLINRARRALVNSEKGSVIKHKTKEDLKNKMPTRSSGVLLELLSHYCTHNFSEVPA